MKKVSLFRLELMAAVLWIAALAWAGSGMPATDGAALHKYITKTSPYTQWALWPGKGKLYKGTEPHGAFLTTYLNDKAAGGLKMRSEGMPIGSIIVKENYTPAKKLAALTVMYKTEGYNPDAGDWFWAKYAPDGTVQAEGKVAACIGCHQVAKARDYLMTDRGMM
jgi:hypothetical protein